MTKEPQQQAEIIQLDQMRRKLRKQQAKATREAFEADGADYDGLDDDLFDAEFFAEKPAYGPSAEDQSSAIQSLYLSHWRHLCHWLRSRFGEGPPEPEDIAQSAFEVIANLEDVTVLEDARAFLYTVAARKAVSGIRWRTRLRKFLNRELDEPEETRDDFTPERDILARERLDRVLAGMESLSEKQREIILRSRIMGQTYKQISQATGWSVPTISRQFLAALARLRQARDDDSFLGDDI